VGMFEPPDPQAWSDILEFHLKLRVLLHQPHLLANLPNV
jgi:hypothetical protein